MRRGPPSAAFPPSNPLPLRFPLSWDPTGGATQQLQAGFLRGFGAVVAYSAGVSHLLLSASAPSNLSIVRTAHSSKLSLPSWLRSSLANALRRGSTSSARLSRPFSSLSARAKRFSSLLLASASGAAGIADSVLGHGMAANRGLGEGAMVGYSACPCQIRKTPVRSRKKAATPARIRAICPSIQGDPAKFW